MPAEKNTLARIVVPIAFIALAAVVVIAVGVNTGRHNAPAPKTAAPASAQTTPAAANQTPADEDQPLQNLADAADQSGEAPEEEAPLDESIEAVIEPGDTLSAIAASADDWRARIIDQTEPFDSIGGVAPDGDDTMLIEFTPAGAGVEAITLARYFTDLAKTEHYPVQRRTTFQTAAGPSVAVVSLAARAVIINDHILDLYSTTNGPIWRQTAPGAFEAIIENAAGDAVARITKRYILPANSYDIQIDQTFENLTDQPMSIEWVQYGPVDLPPGPLGYGGDPRRLRFGYLLSPKQDPSQQLVQTERRIHRRTSIISKPYDPFGRVWPSDTGAKEGWSAVWAAMTNRYFAFVVHPTLDPAAVASGAPVDKALRLASGRIDRVVVGTKGAKAGPRAADPRVIVMQMRSGTLLAAPGASVDLGVSAYTGPKWRRAFKNNPVFTALGMDKLVVFNFGGPCAFCTFQPLSHGMLRFLDFFHNMIFHDWALGIMFLVVCVRGVLHPITKRSQISIQRFSKQMQALGPKQKKLQEKYKDDPKRLKEEMATLMREEGVNFTGALGCLPMFMQSPIWIALYAMLFFAFDLRHQPAFFGAFQKLSGGHWGFLSDLSAPDRFISFNSGVAIPLMGNVSSLNALPLLLGIVFYVHQKYMQPPPSPNATPEQMKQQKFMKVIMVVMFPIFMYNAPSGLAIYFITNSMLGIVESRHIRAHIAKMDLEPKKPSPGKKRVENTQKASPFGKKPHTPKYKERKK